MNNKNPIVDLDNKALKTENILLLGEGPATLPTEALELEAIYDKFGIKNTTKTFIKGKRRERDDEVNEFNKQTGKNVFLKLLIEGFAGYKVIEYKTLHEICVDYGLYINALSSYEKPIPNEVLPSLTSFFDRLAENVELFDKRAKFQKNTDCTLDFNSFDKKLHPGKRYSEKVLGSETMFKIAAPKAHFKVDSFNSVVGQELTTINKPKFKNDIKFNTPKFETRDPIIFLPFQLMKNVYCLIVDAWDKEGDDLRIRQMFK